MTQKILIWSNIGESFYICIGVEALTREGLQREELNEVPGDRTAKCSLQQPLSPKERLSPQRNSSALIEV